MRQTRGALAVLAVLATGAACGPGAAAVGHGREGSWRKVAEPNFTPEAFYSLAGLAGPDDGQGTWTAVGGVRDEHVTKPVVWSAVDGIRWTRADLDTGVDRQGVVAAVVRRGGLAVAVGAAQTPGGHRDARVWASEDGGPWRAVELATVAGGPGDQGMTSVAAGPVGFVAAGFDHSRPRGVPAMWWSPDGMAWSRVGAGPGSPFSAGQAINGVAVGERGAVAVGTIQTSGDIDAMAWFSADGTTWRSVPLGLAGFTGPVKQEARAVTSTVEGYVAVGADANAERRVAAVWRSADGISWQRQPASPDMGQLGGESTAGISVAAVAGRGPVVAVGGAGSLRVWTSPDGRRWTWAQPPVEQRGSDLGALVATDGRGVVVGGGNGGLWFRPFGADWIDVDGDQTVFPIPSRSSTIRSIVRAGERFVALGSVSGGDDGGPAIWTSPDGTSWTRSKPFSSGTVEQVIGFGNDLVAVGTARASDQDGGTAAIWISSDGGATWEPVGVGNPAFRVHRTTQIFGATAGGPGLVAVGLTYDGTQIDAAAWFSADGRTWRRAPGPPAWSGAGDQLLGVACALPGGGVVALGTVTVAGEQDVWAWVSSDGVTWERAGGEGASILAGPGGQYPSGCATTGTGVLVTGTVPGDGGTDGVVWSSTDGRTWAIPADASPFAGPRDEGLFGIDVNAERVVLTGREDDDLTVFTSRDSGATWQKRTALGFGGPADQVAYPIIAGDHVVLAGHDGTSAAVWIGPGP
ncbi:MAG: hypothetical protein ACR2KK_21555 [Acidimicrobiales bacterium]